MSVSVTMGMKLTAVETLDDAVPAISSSNRTVTFDGFDLDDLTLNVSSNPPATKCAYFTKTLAAGAGTIDLTALPHQEGVTVDGTGLKVQGLIVRNDGDNNLVIEPGDSNAYNLLGATFKITVFPGCTCEFEFQDQTPDIASGAKSLKLTGTLVEESSWGFILG